MATITDVDPQLWPGAASLKGVATPACNGRIEVFGVDAFFHSDVLPGRPFSVILNL